VALADVNGDGRPDLVVTNSGDNTLVVLLNTGNGTFWSQHTLTLGPETYGAYSLAVADVNGDGKPDLVTVNYRSSTVKVMLNYGNGAFAERSFATGAGPYAVAAADVNGDGKPDLVTANLRDQTVSVLRGNGDGTFQPGQAFATGSSRAPYAVAVADVNGDGTPDIVVATPGDGTASILLGNGGGSFQPAVAYPIGGADPRSVALADVNGDGRTDLITANYDRGGVSVLLNALSGDFTGQAYTIDQVAPFVAPLVVSIDRAAAAMTTGGSVSWAVTFSEPVTGVDASDFRLALSGSVAATLTQVTRLSGSTYAVTASGVSGSGGLGLNLVDDGSIRDLAGNPLTRPGAPAAFQSPRLFATGAGPTTVAVADVNGDGKPDLVTTNQGDNTVSVVLGNGDGTFSAPRTFPVGSTPGGLAVADVNGDGKPDLAVANFNSNTVSVLLGNGDGTFQSQQTFGTGHGPSAVALADVNGDGRPDLVVTNSGDNTLVVLLNAGNGTFRSQQTLTVGPETYGAYSLAVTDVNGDGKPDLVTVNYRSSTVKVVLGNGDGTFQGAQTINTGPGPYSVAAADVNGDGKPDLVTANLLDQSVSVLLGNGGGTFQPPQALATGSSRAPYAVAVADVNGDGTPDIVVATPGDGTASILLGNGGGSFQPAVAYPIGGADPRSVALADVNGDGRSDLVTANYNSGGVSVLLNALSGDFTGQAYTVVMPPTAHIAGAGTPPSISNTAILVTLVLKATDPDGQVAAAGFTYAINWGDGGSTQISPSPGNGSGYLVGHTYAHSGSYFSSVTATNCYGFVSAPATAAVVLIAQTGGGIAVSGVASVGYVTISLNGTNVGTFRPTDLVYVSGSGGNETYTVNFGSTLTTPICVAGTSSDRLVANGSSGDNTINKQSASTGTISWGPQAGSTAQLLETVSFAGIHFFIIYGGSGKNYIVDPGSDTIINGGAGQNTIVITGTIGTGVVINGGPTTNTYLIDLGSLAGPVTVANTNPSASDSLVVNGAPGDNTISAAGAGVTAGTQTIAVAAPLASLTINGGSGSNQISVAPLSVSVQSLTLNGGPGDDTLTVASTVTAPTTLTAGSGGTDTLQGGGGSNTLVGSTNGGTTTFVASSGTTTVVGGTGDNVIVAGGGQVTVQAPPNSSRPLVFADSYGVLDNGTLTASAAAGVLANDLSADGRALTAVLGSAPAHGTLTLNADGSFRYTPAANFAGSDSFTYQARGSDGSLSAVATVALRVTYGFGGFLAPLDTTLALGLNRTVPIKFQLTDASGAPVSSLSAIASLQVLSGTTDVLAGAGKSSLRYDATARQFVYNWQTKSLPAGTYTVMLTLADGKTYTKVVRLSASGSSKGLLSDTAGTAGAATAGALLAGDFGLYVDNAAGLLTADDLARIGDAVNGLDAVLAPYGITITVVADGTLANVVLGFDSSTPLGGYADGVLGCNTDDGAITLVEGWNWYAGSDATAIGAGQYDFQTVVTHELGHALGLGHSADGTSAMYAALASGETRRALVTADLNVADDDAGPDGLHAAPARSLLMEEPPRTAVSNPFTSADVAMAQQPLPAASGLMGNGLAQGSAGGMAIALSNVYEVRDTALALLMTEWTRTDLPLTAWLDHRNDSAPDSRNAGVPLTGRSDNAWLLLNGDGERGRRDNATNISALDSLFSQNSDGIGSNL
jgi:hypothetical protein